jgi:hydroxymethylbilane synthase
MTLRVGTRGSRLARAQATIAATRLESEYERLSLETIVVRTAGDGSNAPFTAAERGIFVKELEHALLRCEIDVACHSAKDMTFAPPADLALAAFLPRSEARDALIGATALRPGLRVGTSSSRRRAQLLAFEPGLKIVPLRGNVDRRLEQLRSDAFDAIVLSAAGLEHLQLEATIGAYLDPAVFIPEPGQGAVVLQTRRGEESRVSAIDHAATRAAVEAERECARLVGGGCAAPIAAHHADGELTAMISAPDGSWVARAAGRDPRVVAKALLEQVPDGSAAAA